MKRKGVDIKFMTVGALIVGVFVAVSILYLSFLDDLTTTTEVKSSAAYERLGVTEEVLNAACATNARGIFTYDAVVNGELSCIETGRAIGLRFSVQRGGELEVYSYSITGSASGTVVSNLGEGESITRYAEHPRTYHIAVEEGDRMYRGTVDISITGGGWRCEAAGGRCIGEGQACAGSTLELDCGQGRTCCRTTRTVS